MLIYLTEFILNVVSKLVTTASYLKCCILIPHLNEKTNLMCLQLKWCCWTARYCRAFCVRLWQPFNDMSHFAGIINKSISCGNSGIILLHIHTIQKYVHKLKSKKSNGNLNFDCDHLLNYTTKPVTMLSLFFNYCFYS